MSIYMKINGIEGGITATGYEDAIKIISLEEGVNTHSTALIPGHSQTRSVSHPQHREFFLTKKVDNASIKLYDIMHKAQAFPEVTIDFVRSGSSNPEPYLQYTLDNVLVTGIRTLTTGENERPLEILHLNYTKIQKRYTPTNPDLTAGSPSATLYDLATGTNSSD